MNELGVIADLSKTVAKLAKEIEVDEYSTTLTFKDGEKYKVTVMFVDEDDEDDEE